MRGRGARLLGAGGAALRSRLQLPPLRLTIPLALLFTAALMGLYDLQTSSIIALRRVEAHGVQALTQRVSELQQHLEFLLRIDQPERIREAIAQLGSDPHLVDALLLNDRDVVVAALQRVSLQQPILQVRPSLLEEDSRRMMESAREHLAAQIRLTQDGSSAAAWCPIIWRGSATQLSPPDVGILFVEMDLSQLKAQALRQVRMGVVQQSAFLGGGAFLLWLFFHFALTRRVNQLVLTASHFAKRDWSTRNRMKGRDELALVGQAFDELAEHIERTQRQLEERELWMRLLMDSAAEGILGIDLEGRCTFCNRAAVRLLGFEASQEILGWHVRELATRLQAEGQEDRGEEAVLLQPGKEQAVHWPSARLQRADGTGLPIECWSYPVKSNGSVIGQVLSVVDITERKRIEDAQRLVIEVSAQLVRLEDVEVTLARLARLAVPRLAQWCIIDVVREEGDIDRVAAVHEDPSRQQFLEELRAQCPPGWHTSLFIAQVLSTGKPLHLPEVTDKLLRARGLGEELIRLLRQLGLQTAICVPLSARGQTLGAVLLASAKPGFHYSLHELALAQDLVWRASIAVDNARLYRQAQEAIRLREEFLSVASHELHTPLTPLQLQLQSLKRTLKAQNGAAFSQLNPKLEVSLRQVKRLSRLVDDLLDVSRIAAGRLALQREEVNLVELTQELVERFCEQARAAGCTLRVKAEGSICGMWDRMRIEQVLVNLISNALKYGADQPVEIEVAAGSGNAMWLIRDHGIGIAPEHLERIFGRFERAVSARAYGGLGLGLYISQQIVQAHGGMIQAWSKPGLGAIFTVTLPLRPFESIGPESPMMSGAGELQRAVTFLAAKST